MNHGPVGLIFSSIDLALLFSWLSWTAAHGRHSKGSPDVHLLSSRY